MKEKPDKCPVCESDVSYISSTYSCPGLDFYKCDNEECGWSCSVEVGEPIKVLSLEEGMKLRPQMYVDQFYKENCEMKIMLQAIRDESFNCEDAKDFKEWVQENLDKHPLISK